MKATVVNNVENTSRVVNLSDDVRTLGDLKNTLGISEGQFAEGITHTELTDDSQRLPALPEASKERGYVFFVSPVQNKIKNGAYSRKECYNLIKQYNLQDKVKQLFNRNFTQVATDALNGVITNYASAGTAPVQEQAVTSTVEADVTEKDLWQIVTKILSTTTGEYDEEEYSKLIDNLEKGIEKVFHNPYSVQDIANMKE